MKIFQFRRNYAPWISPATRDLMKQRNEAQTQAALTKHPADWERFRLVRNQVTCRLRSEKVNWQNKKLRDSSNNPSSQWQQVLSWLNWKSVASPTQLFYEGKILNKPADIADCQNSFFIRNTVHPCLSC